MQKAPPPRPKQESRDDLRQVSQLEAAEERARAALRLVEQADKEKAELARQLEERDKAHAAELQRQLDAAMKVAQPVPTAVSVPTPTPSQRPGILTVQAKGVKVGIPLALLTPALAIGWAAYQNYTSFVRQIADANRTIAGYEKRFEAQDKQISEVRAEQTQLRETQAAQAGWITGVMPKAGVNVPGTGLEVKSDPLPPGARRQTPVNVRTPVPTPPEK